MNIFKKWYYALKMLYSLWKMKRAMKKMMNESVPICDGITTIRKSNENED